MKPSATELQKWRYKSLLPVENVNEGCRKQLQLPHQFPRAIMFAAGFSWRGQTRFCPIPKDSQITGQVFIKSVLRPILFKNVSRLYGKDGSKVVLHMDSATSHICQETVQWLNDSRTKYITKNQWMLNVFGSTSLECMCDS